VKLVEKNNIVFFDGHCNLCNCSVDLLIKLDTNEQLLYAPLSGKISKELGVINNLPTDELSVIYFRERDQFFNYSDAVIEICSDLFQFCKAFYVFKLIPRFIRDFLYLLVAKNRYKIFGKKETCRIPILPERNFFKSLSLLHHIKNAIEFQL